jgi:hypothetical protein
MVASWPRRAGEPGPEGGLHQLRAPPDHRLGSEQGAEKPPRRHPLRLDARTHSGEHAHLRVHLGGEQLRPPRACGQQEIGNPERGAIQPTGLQSGHQLAGLAGDGPDVRRLEAAFGEHHVEGELRAGARRHADAATAKVRHALYAGAWMDREPGQPVRAMRVVRHHQVFALHRRQHQRGRVHHRRVQLPGDRRGSASRPLRTPWPPPAGARRRRAASPAHVEEERARNVRVPDPELELGRGAARSRPGRAGTRGGREERPGWTEDPHGAAGLERFRLRTSPRPGASRRARPAASSAERRPSGRAAALDDLLGRTASRRRPRSARSACRGTSPGLPGRAACGGPRRARDGSPPRCRR